tara:strand:+ start:2502 stop:4112 length:1611 start_codon:yes stop_codon:yes gene_type:complete
MRISIVQENPTVGDVKGNLALAKEAIQKLRSEDPDVIVFSEMFLTGYPPEDLLLREDLYKSIDRALNELSTYSPNIYLVIGYPKKDKNKIFNTAGVISKGKIEKEYYKQELPNYKVFDEKRYFSPGKGPCLIEIKERKLALTICEDIWFDKAIRQAVKKGAEIILNLNASPFHTGKIKQRKILLNKHVKKFSVPIVYVNQVGGQDELVFDGSSMVLSSDSEEGFQLPSFKSSTKTLEFVYQKGRLHLKKKKAMKDSIDLKDIYEALVLGTRDYIDKNGFKGALIGSSGGIDSALTATIAVDALGSKNVKTIMMPYKFTSEISLYDSKKLAKNLNISHEVIGIEDIYNSFEKSLKKEFKGKKKDKTEENLQSRSRGVLLMALSNKSGYLVLTTGNKSEIAVGYSTLYGDTAGGFSVLKDVPKTSVYELAKYRNSLSHVIPQRIIDRPPSAELAPNQKDSDSLPDYSILDRIIELYVEKDLSLEQIVKKGISKKQVRKIINLIDKNEYKRRQAPLGVKITERGFGKDRRYPITNKHFH